jgi:hypothetical protein
LSGNIIVVSDVSMEAGVAVALLDRPAGKKANNV